MSDHENIVNAPEKDQTEPCESNIAASSAEVSSLAGSVKTAKTSQRVSSSSERLIKFERAQKCLENAVLVSKRIKEHRKATAELLGKPFEEDDGGDTASEIASTMSERTGYSVATDTSTTLSVQDALNIPGISESLANTLKQKELLMERIKQYKEITKRSPIVKSTTTVRRESTVDPNLDLRKSADNNEQLINAIKVKENTLSVMQVKMKSMETTILDLQEKINEKDQIIEAKNRATTLISDSLSKKEKDSLDLLEDTRQQMTKMQENFIIMETEWKEEKQRLLNDIETKEDKIKSLEEANTILETSRFEISVEHSKLLEELESKNKEISHLQDHIQRLSQQLDEKPSEKEKNDYEEEKGSREITNMVELSQKIEVLEQLNCQIRQTNKELENKLAAITSESKSVTSGSPSKKIGSPLPARKGGRTTASKQKSPWSNISSESLPQELDKKQTKSELTRLEMLVQSLNKDVLDKEYTILQKEALIVELQNKNDIKTPVVTGPDMVDVGTSTDIADEPRTIQSQIQANPNVSATETSEEQLIDVNELKLKLKKYLEQITLLNNDIDVANKNMVKVKSTHKLKLKQLQKTIDNFSKVSDSNAEIVKLNEEIHQLSQKVAELEEEKGNLQLHLVDYDSGRLTESDVYKKLVDMENLAETRLKAISVLETQKFDLVQELHILQQKNIEIEDKLADISQQQSEQVSTEIKSVQLEEQVDELTASKKELELLIDNLKLDKDQLNSTIKELQEEKDELNHKLENYIQENIDLTDKLEKLSVEKVSSAESIEMVESLTTQEKLELEEYNKGIVGEKVDDQDSENMSSQNEKSIENLIEQSEELNKKIELFTEEREEVMDRMNKITNENESLIEKTTALQDQCASLQDKIDQFDKEKHELQDLNHELSRQIDLLKQERIEIIKETVDITKPSHEDVVDAGMSELQHDDKATEKGMNRTKSVKQLTKEILKLKNIIKEREDEIGDCQMKILSLEEHQQKQNEIMLAHANNESKLKLLVEENLHLKEEINQFRINKEADQEQVQYKQALELLQQEAHRMQQEYSNIITVRDSRINELEGLLVEYEKQILNYNATMQQKDKDLTEYINQITKLNDVSQKLKSTIDLLEEEKAKDQNAELIKSLNKQIVAYQKKIAENEDKLRVLDEDKAQLMSLKSVLESKHVGLDSELQSLRESYVEKETLIKELEALQQKHSKELSEVKTQAKDRDEEIHEIKLQLRKESIENEKLRNNVDEKEKYISELALSLKGANDTVAALTSEKDTFTEQLAAMENKNKELLEKLKKFAINIKKKSSMYADLENKLIETQTQLEAKNEYLAQLSIQVNTLPSLQEKLKHAEEEINRLQSLKINIDQQKSQDIDLLQNQVESLEESLKTSSIEITRLNETMNILHKDLHFAHDVNTNQKCQIDSLSNKIVEHEIEQKNNINLITKVTTLESELIQKQKYIAELIEKLESSQQQETQNQFGFDAKIQERDLYIESLETEISQYKGRIGRLEDSISVMEDRRHSLERKADQLGNQLQEKQKAYSEYTNQEDELVGRLAVLIDHDRVIEKQLHEIDSENKELQFKIQQFTEDNQKLRKSLSDIQEYCNTLVDKASKADFAESELVKYQTQTRELEVQLKRVTHEHQLFRAQNKKDIEELESEFNTQIEAVFKEKKALSEKYEKLIEHVSQIESKLNKYKINNENMNASLQELNRLNQELISEKSVYQDQPVAKDYTDQYITEINNLNAILNDKNQEILNLSNKIHTVQTHNFSTTSTLESKIAELLNQLQVSSADLDRVVQECNESKQNIQDLQNVISQKDNHIKELIETKSLTFEMNIPKTEGMVISSRIEPVSAEPQFDVSSLESQILSDVDISHPEAKIVTPSEQLQTRSVQNVSADQLVETLIQPKTAYICYQGEDNTTQETDPFNSDEGWGLGDGEEIVDIIPGLSHLNEQIQKLVTDKDKLKMELDSSNVKLVKALKKLKELKSTNEVLSNELRISKQLSQSSFLDSAIEDELKLKVEELEKKIAEVNADIHKERKEKESLRKQNDVISNANDRLTEMKEKLENEIDLWKYKCKEVNDKASTLQWGSDSKTSPKHEVTAPSASNDKLKEEIVKIEHENEELQQSIEQITSKNNELLILQTQLKTEVESLKSELNQRQVCEKCVILNTQVQDLQNNNTELIKSMEILNEKLREVEIRCNELIQNYDTLKYDNEKIQNELQRENKNMTEKYMTSEHEIEHLRKVEEESNKKIISLSVELDHITSKLATYEEQKKEKELIEDSSVSEIMLKYESLQEQCSQFKHQLEEANNKIIVVETENNELLQLKSNYSEQINQLNAKMLNLNDENDSLLSTVAELRNSVSSAVDQRGFEIAELWKQHLAQRENDFQKIEVELRNQISASEAKYEQLLDNVQSSSQEETSKLVMMEQVNSLQNKLHDKEEHLRDLQDKYAEVINQIDMLRSEMQDEKITHENKLLEQQEEYEKTIQDLITKNKENSQMHQETLKNIQTELAESKSKSGELSQQLNDMILSLSISNERIVDLENQLQLKENDIKQKLEEFAVALTQRNEEFENARQQLVEYEKAIEELNYEKESELAVLRLKMHENNNYYEKVQGELEKDKLTMYEELQAKITECTNLSKQIADLNKTLEEHSNKALEVQSALENQELEIVTLKDEIVNLESLLRSTNSKMQKHVSFASDTKPASDDEVSSEGGLRRELLDAVPRAELDLALYMLHQRDVRCEELTMELTQLLEERDTLQLRLSDSLRMTEELKAKCKEAGLEESIEYSEEALADLPVFSVEKEQQFVNTHKGQTSRSSSISDPDGDKPKLQAKLSELRSVRHSRDVTLRHESESRQMDMRLLQRDVALLPAEARDHLAQAHHTLSRDSQSTSTVLLNWLRGKSTPKVVHM